MDTLACAALVPKLTVLPRWPTEICPSTPGFNIGAMATVAKSAVKLNSTLALPIRAVRVAESMDVDASPFVRLEIPNTELSTDWLVSAEIRENEIARTDASETVDVSDTDLLMTRFFVTESDDRLTSAAVADLIRVPEARSDVKEESGPTRIRRNDLAALSDDTDTSDADLWVSKTRTAASLLNVASDTDLEKTIVPRLALSDVLLVSNADVLLDPP